MPQRKCKICKILKLIFAFTLLRTKLTRLLSNFLPKKNTLIVARRIFVREFNKPLHLNAYCNERALMKLTKSSWKMWLARARAKRRELKNIKSQQVSNNKNLQRTLVAI